MNSPLSQHTAAALAAPATYCGDDGVERRDRRRRGREDDDPRIEHLFNGLDNLIASARENEDAYSAGYIGAMRVEFGQVIASLIR